MSIETPRSEADGCTPKQGTDSATEQNHITGGTDVSPTLDELMSEAERIARKAYELAPQGDVRHRLLLSVDGRVVDAGLPEEWDERRKLLVACFWLPTAIVSTEAKAAVLMQACWAAPCEPAEPYVQPSWHRDRQEAVIIHGSDALGNRRFRVLAVTRGRGGTELSPMEFSDAAESMGLYLHAMAWALEGDLDDWRQHSMAKHVQKFSFSNPEDRAAAGAAILATTDFALSGLASDEPQGFCAVVGAYATTDNDAIAKACASHGGRPVELTADELRALITKLAVLDPLEQAGLPLARLLVGGFADADLQESLDSLVLRARPFDALSSAVGRNAPCPCDSGVKFKKCCGDGQQRGARPTDNTSWAVRN